LLGDADVLPIQVMREVEYLFTNSTHISSSPPYERWKMMMKSIAIDRISIQILTTTLSTQNSIYNHVVIVFHIQNNIQPRCQFKYNSIRSKYHVDIHAIVSHKLNSLLPDKYDCRSH